MPIYFMTAWVGAAPSENRKRAVSTVEHMDQSLKKAKSTASKSIKPTNATIATQQGQSIKYMCMWYLLIHCTLLAPHQKPAAISLMTMKMKMSAKRKMLTCHPRATNSINNQLGTMLNPQLQPHQSLSNLPQHLNKVSLSLKIYVIY